MKWIKLLTQNIKKRVFSRLEESRKNYERTMINNMESLYQVIRKGDVLLVEGDSQISRMIKLFTQSTWSHSALYVGGELLIGKGGHREAVLDRFGNNDAHHMLVEAFATTGVTASPLRKYQDFNIRVCRPYGILESDMDAVVSEVIGNLGRQYDHRNITDLALLLLPPLLNPFKKRTIQACLGNCNEFQVICSGMIAKAFQRVGYPIIPALGPKRMNATGNENNPYGASLIMRHYSQILPKHFDISPNFQIIKFNIIEGGFFDYKTLWAQTIFDSPSSKIVHQTCRQDLEQNTVKLQ